MKPFPPPPASPPRAAPGTAATRLQTMRPLTFLSDYGTDDEFVGVVHAVVAKLAPEARIIDLSHGIPRHGVLQGALTLARTLPYAPPGVHLAVVDPEVGARRRAVALRTVDEDRLLVGPDNGLLRPAAERFGGIAEAVEISASPRRERRWSPTSWSRSSCRRPACGTARSSPLSRGSTASATSPCSPATRISPPRACASATPWRCTPAADGSPRRT